MPKDSSTQPPGLPFIELQSVDSTNNYARQKIYAGLAHHGMAIFAHEQVAGKGQRGKVWCTERGSNIILSLVIEPQSLLLAQQFQLSACVAVAAHEFFIKYAGDETKIKWPNDLFWQDRKAGGILIESIVTGPQPEINSQQTHIANTSSIAQWKWSIAGMGININQTHFPSDLPNPVSLKQITGKNFDVVDLAKELVLIFNKHFTELIENGFENIYSTYLAHLYKRNVTVKLKKGPKVFEAMINGVSPRGKLITHHAIDEEFDLGEVEWIIK